MKKFSVDSYLLTGCCLLLVLLPIRANAELVLTKEFPIGIVAPGSDIVLTFTLKNTDKDFAVTGITFTDDLNEMSEEHHVRVVPPIPEPDCGTLESVSGNSLLRFTNGSLAADTSCVLVS